MLIADGLSAFGRRTPVDTHVPCGHFSGGRGSWWRFHLLGYAAKEETLNIRDAHEKFAEQLSLPGN
jgi:hypothetical protein